MLMIVVVDHQLNDYGSASLLKSEIVVVVVVAVGDVAD